MISKFENLDPIEFSVIVPLFNKEKSIFSTIESILHQTYTNFELIIINDGSTDDSLNVVQSFNDPRIKIYNKPNGGVSRARNLGVEKSKNKFVVFLDADDLWLPFCLEEFCRLIIEFPDADVFCTNFNMTGKNLEGSDRRYLVEDYFYALAFYLAKWSIQLIITGCVSIRRNLFNEIGCFNEDITHGEDIDMWDRLGFRYKIAKSEKITTIYRTEAENRASLVDESLKLKATPFVLKRHEILSKSQKLYIGVQTVFELRLFLFSGKNLYFIKSYIKYLDLIFRGVLFIIKVRFFNITFFHCVQ